MANLTGTAGDDSLVGTSDNDYFDFSRGNDTLIGGEGYDSIFVSAFEGVGLPSGTVVDFGAGSIIGTGVNHSVSGIENIFVEGGSNITLRGGAGADSLNLTVTSGTSLIEGRGGDDDIVLEALSTGAAYGGDGDDQFYVLDVRNATVEGGSGNDTLVADGYNDSSLEVITNSAGQYVLTFSNGAITLLDEIEYFIFSDDTTLSAAEVLPQPAIEGTDTGDVITGTSNADALNALGGNDWIMATAGEDTIDGGTGTDMLSFVGQADRVTVNLGQGRAEIGMGGPTDIQQIIGVENLTGSSRGDHLGGGAGANIIRGLGGADKFIGTAGGDVVDGGAGTDVWVPNTFTPVSATNISLLRGRIWEGDGAGTRFVNIENVIGDGGNDSLTGDHGANRLEGRDGDDVLMGNGGDDLIYGGFGDDVALYSYDMDQYDVTTTEGVTTVSYIGAGAGDGTDLLLHIETLRFADGDLML